MMPILQKCVKCGQQMHPGDCKGGGNKEEEKQNYKEDKENKANTSNDTNNLNPGKPSTLATTTWSWRTNPKQEPHAPKSVQLPDTSTPPEQGSTENPQVSKNSPFNTRLTCSGRS